ncbi:MAG: ABC transporter substrate binding protein [Oscillospiraceae bacterium]
MLQELFPDAEKVGILYCSGEPNSKFQADTITPMLEEMGYTVAEYTFADSNDVANVTATALSECDVIYIPTDNTAASCPEAINNVALVEGVPIVAGEEGLCKGCGVASLSISYYDLGYVTGKMALEILTEGADISTMEIRYAPQTTKMYNASICETLGITVPEDYVAVAEE